MFPLAVAQSPGDSVTSIDRNLIVDCRLPPQVRKLGMNVVTQMPGRVVKVSKIECETRGGLYVLFDAADPETALKIWLDSAKQGDANAQNRVGQIYELGIAGPPNYAEAAKWYRLAVDNGSRAAAINLATLYDQGLGVAKDHKAAADLYRQAEGVGAGAGKPMPPTELEKSRQRVQELEKELAALKGRLASSQGDDLAQRAVDVKGLKVLAARLDGADAKTLRDTLDKLKDKLKTAVIVLAAVDGSKVQIAAGVTADSTARVKAGEVANYVAGQVGGKGGGKPDMAMAGGTDPSRLPAALASVQRWVEERV